MKKTVILLICIILLTLTGCNSSDYKKAVNLCKKGEYADALPILRQLGDYKDATSLRRSAAYAAVREYIKSNGTADYHALSSDISTDKATFSYAIEQKDDNEKNYYIYAAVTENDEIALGFRYDIRSKGAGFNIITVGSFWILLPEAGNIAATNFSEGFSTAYIGKTMNSVQNGQGSFDITKYTETMSMDMPVKQWMKDINGQETTEDKKLSEAKNKTWMSGASKTPVSAESLFTESGVTLSDLGFTLLNTDSSADINDQ